MQDVQLTLCPCRTLLQHDEPPGKNPVRAAGALQQRAGMQPQVRHQADHHCSSMHLMQVGASTLQKALKRLGEQAGNPAVVVGMEGGDDAALTQPPPPGKLLVHTVDFLRSFTEDPWLFGAITANHALGVSSARRHITPCAPNLLSIMVTRAGTLPGTREGLRSRKVHWDTRDLLCSFIEDPWLGPSQPTTLWG